MPDHQKGNGQSAPTKSHLTDTAEVLDASEEPLVLLPGLATQNSDWSFSGSRSFVIGPLIEKKPSNLWAKASKFCDFNPEFSDSKKLEKNRAEQ